MIHVLMHTSLSTYCDDSPSVDNTVRFEASHITLEILFTALQTVQYESGCGPEYCIVGWKTYYELVVMVGLELVEEILGGAKLIPDTAREHYFAAVADIEWQVGRPLPPRSVWTYEPGRGWTSE